MVDYWEKKKTRGGYSEPECPFIKDWALYVRIPHDGLPTGHVISWHSTEYGARVARKGNMKLGIRIRQGREWDGINVE
jgi:hypothetical protein